MAYTTNRRGIYRTGFRPAAGSTNPFAAAQLSGVPARRIASPFGPAVLHLGQSHPFTASGGYGLHGLGDIIPNQSVVTYLGTWSPGVLGSAETAIGTVLSALTQDGFAIRDVSSAAAAGAGPFKVTLQLQVDNGLGFSDASDIIAIIQQEVFAATGATPIADSIPNVRLPHRGSPRQQHNASWLLFGLGLLLLSGGSRRKGR